MKLGAGAVGVPEITPPVLRLSPAGSEPDDTVQTSEGVPPDETRGVE